MYKDNGYRGGECGRYNANGFIPTRKPASRKSINVLPLLILSVITIVTVLYVLVTIGGV
jgi:hypothetical protein